MGQMHMSNSLLSVLQNCLDPENYGLSKLKYNGYLFPSNRLTCSPNILIIGWWSSNPREEARVALGYVPNIRFATLDLYVVTAALLFLLPLTQL